jgi:hypothetical protein
VTRASHFGLFAFLALIGACTGVAMRDKALPPAMAQAFPAVRMHVVAGIAAQNPPLSVESVVAITADLDAIEAAVAIGDRVALLPIDWSGTLRPLAEAGVMARAQSGEIELGVAQSRLETVRLFSEAWTRAVSR